MRETFKKDQRELNAPSAFPPRCALVSIFYLALMTAAKYFIFKLTLQCRIKFAKPIIKL